MVGNLIYPRLQAETQNIDPVVTLLRFGVLDGAVGLPGAFLAVPLTLMSMMVFAQFPDTKWVAALLSNDGNPVFRRAGKEARPNRTLDVRFGEEDWIRRADMAPLRYLTPFLFLALLRWASGWVEPGRSWLQPRRRSC